MKARSLLLVSALAAAAATQAAGLAGNSIAVYQVGDGSAALTSAATPTFVVNFNTAQNSAALGSYAVPTVAAGTNNALTDSGSATSDGQLTLSGDGKSILFGGYNAAVGTASVASSSATRVVGSLGVSSGTINTSTVTGTAFAANNIRSVYSPDSASYYAVGGNSGVVGGALGSNGGATIGTPTITNLRYVTGFNGGVYFSTGSGAARGVYQVDPATGVQTSVLNLGAAANTYAFQFLNASTLLVGDATSGISVYTNAGSGFSAVPTATLATATTQSLVFNNGVVYYTSSNGTALNAVTYDATTGFGTPTALQTAATNTVFRGVTFVPQAVPEPSAFAALGLGALGLLRRRRKA